MFSKIITAFLAFKFSAVRDVTDMAGRWYDLFEQKSSGRAFTTYFVFMFAGIVVDMVLLFLLKEGGVEYVFWQTYTPSLFFSVAVSLFLLHQREVGSAWRVIWVLLVAGVGGYYTGAIVGFLPLVYLLKQPLKDDGVL